MITQQTENILDFSINFMITFGYLGVGLVLLSIAYFIWKRSRTGSYICGAAGLVLIIAYAGFDILSRYFPKVLVSRSNISGLIVGAKQPEPVRVGVGNKIAQGPFMRRENDPENIELTRHFFIASYQDNYRCMTLSIGGPVPEPMYFNLPVMSADASASRLLVISLKRKEGNLSGAALQRYQNSTPLGNVPVEDLKTLDINVPSCENAPPEKQSSTNLFEIVGRASAQERQPSPDELAKYKNLLESSDPFVRRNARQELAGLGPNAIPIVEALLKEQSYQLQLGALVAVDGLPASVRANVPENVRNRVQQLQQHPDPTMRNAANRALH